MGTVLTLAPVDDGEIDVLLAEPKRIEEFYGFAEHAAVWEKYGTDLPFGDGPRWLRWLSRLFGGPGVGRSLRVTEQLLAELPKGPEGEIDLDKAWNGLHFLLTGTADGGDGPGAFIIEGGTEVGDVDVGYGPARAFRSDEVAAIDAHLRSLTDDELLGRLDQAAMTRLSVYPDVWDEPPEESLEYLGHYLGELRGFLTATTERSSGMVVRFC
ncbi:MAG: YfbM family protein [Planctomycetota bacterium]